MTFLIDFLVNLNVNMFDFLFNIVSSLGIMLNTIANTTIHITIACFIFIIFHLIPFILIIITIPILVHFLIKDAFEKFCLGLGAVGAATTVYGVARRNPIKNKLVEEIKRQNERIALMEDRHAQEAKELLADCKAKTKAAFNRLIADTAKAAELNKKIMFKFVSKFMPYGLIIFQYLKYSLLKFKHKLLESNLAFFSLILSKILNIDLPQEPSQIFNLASGVFTMSALCLYSFFNLLSTLLILHYKDKYNLELRFKDYPLILKFIKYYEKMSNINIIWQILFIFCILSALTGLTLLILFRILNNN